MLERPVGHLEQKSCCLVVLPQITQVSMWFLWQARQFWQPGCASVTHSAHGGMFSQGVPQLLTYSAHGTMCSPDVPQLLTYSAHGGMCSPGVPQLLTRRTEGCAARMCLSYSLTRCTEGCAARVCFSYSLGARRDVQPGCASVTHLLGSRPIALGALRGVHGIKPFCHPSALLQ